MGIEKTILDNLSEIHKKLKNEERLAPQETLNNCYNLFRSKFGPEKLSELDGEELLETMHLHGNKNSLVYWLEFKDDEEFPNYFGGIGGGSAFKFGIYRRKETNEWRTGTPTKPKDISVDEAILIAKKHRDQLIKASMLFDKLPDVPEENHYRDLQKEIMVEAPDIADTAWGHKYLGLIHPDKLDDFHNLDFKKFHLIKLLQTPPEPGQRYILASRYVEIARNLGIPINHLTAILIHRNGSPYKYWRIGTKLGGKKSIWENMREGEFIAIGGPDLGDLSDIQYSRESKNKLKTLMNEKYPNAPGTVGYQTQQIFNFVTVIKENDVVMASDGSVVLGIGRVTGDYFFEANSEYPHRRNVDWLSLKEWEMPNPEGLQTKVKEIKKYVQNLIEVEKNILDSESISPSAGGQMVRMKFSGIIGRAQKILERKKQVILYGPPGTGKTFWAYRAACELAALQNLKGNYKNLNESQKDKIINNKNQNEGFVRFCCFHPEYGYEDFIEGYRPIENKGQLFFKPRDGFFKKLCDDATKNPTNNYFLIIDEINRGDIPRIFGELITLIETDKRGMSLILPVSGNIFQVPENIMIIGTMNTADRSIALLDTALRRRFGFIELMPDFDVLEDNVLEGIPLRLWLKTLNQRICKNIGKDARNLQIGHAYLMHNGKTINSFKKFAQIIQEDIIPLLEEYCYEDYAILEKLLGTALIDNAQMRIRNEIFEDTDTKKLTTALLATCPELSTSEPSVDSELEDEADEEGNEDIDSNES